MFHLLISPRVIVKGEYHDVWMCYRCFQLDDHVAIACVKGNQYLICSNWSFHTHNFRQCNAIIKSCLNCYGNHATVARTCPEIKMIASRKITDKQGKSYSAAVVNDKNKIATINASKTDIENIISKYLMCLLISMLKESEKVDLSYPLLNPCSRRITCRKFRLTIFHPQQWK